MESEKKWDEWMKKREKETDRHRDVRRNAKPLSPAGPAVMSACHMGFSSKILVLSLSRKQKIGHILFHSTTAWYSFFVQQNTVLNTTDWRSTSYGGVYSLVRERHLIKYVFHVDLGQKVVFCWNICFNLLLRGERLDLFRKMIQIGFIWKIFMYSY